MESTFKTTKEISKEKQTEYQENKMFELLQELHKHTKNKNAKLSLTAMAEKIDLPTFFVHEIISHKVVRKFSTGKDGVIYTWTHNNEPSIGLAKNLVAAAKANEKIKKLNAKEQEKFLKNKEGKKLRPISGVALSGIGTVLTFIKDVHSKLLDGVNEAYFVLLHGSKKDADFSNKKIILECLLKIGSITLENGLYKWHDKEVPDIEFAKTVVECINSTDFAGNKQNNPRSINVLKAIEKCLRLAETSPEKNPLDAIIGNPNLRALINKLDVIRFLDGKYRLILNQGESIEQASVRIHELLKNEQRQRYHKTRANIVSEAPIIKNKEHTLSLSAGRKISEFVSRHDSLFRNILDERGNLQYDNILWKPIILVAREELEYSPTTVSVDIARILANAFYLNNSESLRKLREKQKASEVVAVETNNTVLDIVETHKKLQKLMTMRGEILSTLKEYKQDMDILKKEMGNFKDDIMIEIQKIMLSLSFYFQ